MTWLLNSSVARPTYDIQSLVYDIDDDDAAFIVVTPSENSAARFDLFTG